MTSKNSGLKFFLIGFFLLSSLFAYLYGSRNIKKIQAQVDSCFEYTSAYLCDVDPDCKWENSSCTDCYTNCDSCEVKGSENGCETNDACLWYQNTCIDKPDDCSFYTNIGAVACNGVEGCMWYTDECVNQPDDPCVIITDATTCDLAVECVWQGDSCIEGEGTVCENKVTEAGCLPEDGCRYVNGSCIEYDCSQYNGDGYGCDTDPFCSYNTTTDTCGSNSNGGSCLSKVTEAGCTEAGCYYDINSTPICSDTPPGEEDEEEEEHVCPRPDLIFKQGFKKAFSFNPKACIFQGIFGSEWDTNIIRTLKNIIVGGFPEILVFATTGYSQNQLQACAVRLGNEEGGMGIEVEGEIKQLAEDKEKLDCSNLERNSLESLAYGGVNDNFASKLNNITSHPTGGGSLMSLTLTTQAIANTSQPPASIDYFARKTVEKIPIARNTAYASALDTHADWLWTAVYDLWSKSKNIAYGLLALFMLYVGIMIMLRKEIDPRTSVTIQNALPRIIISLALITFSYVIGGLAADLVIPLKKAAWGLVDPLKVGPAAWGRIGIVAILALFLTSTVSVFSGIGFISMILYALCLILFLFILIKMYARIIIAYVKIAIQVIIGPFILAWGAIPGNEKAIMDWFKRIGVELAAVPILNFGLAVSIFMLLTMLSSVFDGTNAGAAFLGTLGGATIIMPVFLLMVMWYFSKLPKQLEDAAFDKKR